MATCSLDEYAQTDATIGISIPSVILGIFIIIFIVSMIMFFTKTEDSTFKFENTLFSKMSKYFGDNFSKISTVMFIAILVSGLINTFNALIITPIVQASIPDQTLLTSGVTLGRNVWMYPFQFFISLLGFIITICILFFIAELFNLISTADKAAEIFNWTIFVFIVLCLIGMIGWNGYTITHPNCGTQPGSQAPQIAAALHQQPPITPINTTINSMGGIRFNV